MSKLGYPSALLFYFCETWQFLILAYAQKAKAFFAPTLAEPFQL